MATGVIDGLFVRLGYDVDQKKIDGFNKSIDKTTNLLRKTSLAAIGTATAFALMFKTLASGAAETERFARARGLDPKRFEALRRVADQLTGSADKANNVIGSLSDTIVNMQQGIPPSTEFLRGLAAIGLEITDLGDNPVDALLKINKGLQGLDQATQQGVTNLLGMNDAFLLLTDQDLAGKINEASTKIDFRKIKEFDKLVRQLSQTFEELVLNVGVEFLPKINEFLNNLKASLPLILGIVGEVTSGILTAFDVVGKFIGETIGRIELAVDKLPALADSVKDFFDFSGIGQSLLNVVGLGESENSAASLAAGATTNNSSTSSTSNSQTNNISIVGNDPVAIAEETARRIQSAEFKKTAGNLKSKVAN